MTHMPKRPDECDMHYVSRLQARAESLGCTIEIGALASDGWRPIHRVSADGRRVNIGAVRTLARHYIGCKCPK